MENPKTLEIGDVLLGEVKVFDIVNHLFQPGGDRITVAAWVGAVECVEDDSLGRFALEVALHHRQLVEIRQQSKVECAHSFSPFGIESRPPDKMLLFIMCFSNNRTSLRKRVYSVVYHISRKLALKI